MQNITEIVFGDSIYHELKNSEFAKKNKFIKFEFDMVLELADLSNIDNNILKLNKDFCSLMSSELNCEIKETISFNNIIKELNESIQNKHKIRIWTSHTNINLYMMLLYICNFFSNIDYDLYVVFSDEYNNTYYTPGCMKEEELRELSKLEHKLSKDDIIKYSLILKQTKENNNEMIIYEDNDLKVVSLDYYNEIILDKLSKLDNITVSSLVVNLMKGIYFLDDKVFTFLIKRLIDCNKIIIVDEKERLWVSTVAINNVI